jgi:hypothetical protein
LAAAGGEKNCTANTAQKLRRKTVALHFSSGPEEANFLLLLFAHTQIWQSWQIMVNMSELIFLWLPNACLMFFLISWILVAQMLSKPVDQTWQHCVVQGSSWNLSFRVHINICESAETFKAAAAAAAGSQGGKAGQGKTERRKVKRWLKKE